MNFGSEITKDRRGSEDWSCLHFVQQVGVIIWKKKYSDIGSNLAQKQHPWCPSSFFIGYTSCNSTQMKIQDYTASTVKNSRAATGTFQAILVSKVCQKIQTTSGHLTILTTSRPETLWRIECSIAPYLQLGQNMLIKKFFIWFKCPEMTYLGSRNICRVVWLEMIKILSILLWLNTGSKPYNSIPVSLQSSYTMHMSIPRIDMCMVNSKYTKFCLHRIKYSKQFLQY